MEIKNNVKASGTVASYQSTGLFHTYVSDHPAIHMPLAHQIDVDIIKHLYRDAMSQIIHP